MPEPSTTPAKAIISGLPGKRAEVIKKALKNHPQFRKLELEMELSKMLWSGDVKYRVLTQEFYRG